MYSKSKKLKAVRLYIKYGLRAAPVIRELGYPNRHMLVNWYRQYLENGDFPDAVARSEKFSTSQKNKALHFYETHGRCAAYTIKCLGYPSHTTFKRWLAEAYPERRKPRVSCRSAMQLPQDRKQEAVIALCTRTASAKEIADKYGVNRISLYFWKNNLLGKDFPTSMQKTRKQEKSSESEQITEYETADEEIARLKDEIQRLRKEQRIMDEKLYKARIEYDAISKAAELLKKAKGINLKELSNREKTEIIDALRTKYRLSSLLPVFDISKSSYFYQSSAIHRKDKYSALRIRIRSVFYAAKKSYGYRRIYHELKNEGITVSEKVVRRLMHEGGLNVYYKKRKKYSSYMGEITPAVPNLLQRNFHAECPNRKWLTDITEFSIPAGKIYLSPIIDCYDGMAVSWSIGESPSAELVNSMLDRARVILKKEEHPIIHSDRGAHYRWQGWIGRMEEFGLCRSMSKKGCSPDNAACEGFFGRLKNEFFYGREWKDTTIEEFITCLNNYIRWYNEKRIKASLNWMSPLQYRMKNGFI